MTKRNLTLGSASGKLGSVVYFRRRGQQIARLLVSSPRDPRTLAQCRQRAKFANYVNAWRYIKPYVGESWRGSSRYGSSENAFYHHNRTLMPAISKTMSRYGYAYPPLGIVTYGSLQVGISMSPLAVQRPAPDTGLSDASIPLRNTSSVPQTTTQLAGAFVAEDVGITPTDIIHILAWCYPISQMSSTAAAVGESAAPLVYHVAVSASMTSISLSTAAPWLLLTIGNDTRGRRALGVEVMSSYLPNEPAYGYVDRVFTMWVERPSNPQYSRFSRASFVSSEDVLSTLRDLSGDTELANTMALTYQTI